LIAMLAGASIASAQSAASSSTISVAAAANFSVALDALTAGFKKFSPGTTVVTTTGASGSLVAQIKNGAPYDVFLSADVDYPQALIKAGEADAASFTTFATGRLVLWTTRPDLALPSVVAAVRDPAVKKIAIANLDTAPYGRAARQALEALGAWVDAQPKLAVGENITQTAQFVETGNADIGFVSLSIVLAPTLKERGRWLEVPADLHAPLAHGAVLTRRGANQPAAKAFLEFLHTPAARTILESFGYSVPK
jgi:molybdate transport system substrate-binding protein